jgi:hypothetical protein
MENVRGGGWALILGALSFIALMVVHPMMAGGGPVIGALSLSGIVHGTAIVMQPVLLWGFWQLTRLMAERPLAQIALCFYALAAALTLMAAAMSGLIIPEILHAAHAPASMPGPAPEDPHVLQQTLQGQAIYTVWLNQAFAFVQVGLFAIAILLWSIAWPGRTPFVILVRSVGVLGGIGVIAWALSGAMTLEAQHGALLVTVVQMAWTLLAATAMLISRDAKGG